MKKYCSVLVLVPIFVLMVILSGCITNPPDSEGIPTQEPIDSSISDQDHEVEAEPPPPSDKEPEVLDFAVLSEDDFPRGAWTVNQLIDKYGEPDTIVAEYLAAYRIVSVRIDFTSIYVHFYFKDVAAFSFNSEALEGGEGGYYEMNDADKNLELIIAALWVYDKDVTLPYGLKIGESTRNQVLEAYPSGAAYSDPETIFYHYAFKREDGSLPELVLPEDRDSERGTVGSMYYLFDKNEVLYRVDVVQDVYYGV